MRRTCDSRHHKRPPATSRQHHTRRAKRQRSALSWSAYLACERCAHGSLPHACCGCASDTESTLLGAGKAGQAAGQALRRVGRPRAACNAGGVDEAFETASRGEHQRVASARPLHLRGSNVITKEHSQAAPLWIGACGSPQLLKRGWNHSLATVRTQRPRHKSFKTYKANCARPWCCRTRCARPCRGSMRGNEAPRVSRR